MIVAFLDAYRGTGSVEPFIQVCTACQSRVRIRNHGMIGQVVNCPKCESAMTIAGPQKIHIDGARGSVADSHAMTKDAFPNVEQFESLDFSKPDESPATAIPGQSLFDGEFTDAELMFQVEELATTTPPLRQPVAWATPDKPLLPSEQWTSPTTTRRQQVLMITFIGMFSLLVAIGSFYAFIRWVSVPTAEKQPVANSSATTDSSNDQTSPQVVNESSENSQSSTTPSETNSDTAQPTTDADATVPDVTGNTPPNKTESKTVVQPALPSEAEQKPSPDPLATNPPGGSATEATKNVAVNLGAGNSQSDLVLSLPASLQEIAGILDATKTPVVDASIPLAPPPTANGDAAAEPFAETPDAEPLAEPSVAAKALQVEISGISIARRPLSEAINTISQLANLPIAVDFDSLTAANVNRDQHIELKETNRPASEVFDVMANAIGGHFEHQDSLGVTLVGSAERMQENVAKSLDLSGLAPETQITWAKTLDSLFPDKKETWQLVNGSIQTDAPAFSRQWLQLANTVTLWRRYEQRSASAPAFPFAAIENALELEITHHANEPKQLWVTLTQVLRQAKLKCWIDWPSIARVGVTPQTTCVVLASHRSLREILAEVQRRYDLVFVIEDPQTVVVTTRDGRRAYLKTYVFDAEGRNTDQWKEQLELAEPSELAGLPPFRIGISPDGKFAIVRSARLEIGL